MEVKYFWQLDKALILLDEWKINSVTMAVIRSNMDPISDTFLSFDIYIFRDISRAIIGRHFGK